MRLSRQGKKKNPRKKRGAGEKKREEITLTRKNGEGGLRIKSGFPQNPTPQE